MAASPTKTAARALGVGVAIAFAASGFAMLVRDSFSLETFGIAMGIGTLHALFVGVPAALTVRALRAHELPRGPLARFLTLMAALFGCAIVGSLIAGGVLVAIGLFSSQAFLSRFAVGIAVTLAGWLLVSAGVASYERVRQRLEGSEIDRLRAEQLATAARLASLQSRTRPHFLFNAINAALALIPDDPARAERVLVRMSALLRSSLDAEALETVPLSREMTLVSDYLEIEGVRFGERLRVDLDVVADAGELRVPPFAVQTLVENAVKYAVAPRPEGGSVSVRARLGDDAGTIEVVDDGPGFERSAVRPHHGLDNLREQLATLFGAAAELVIARAQGGGARVVLSLPKVAMGRRS